MAAKRKTKRWIKIIIALVAIAAVAITLIVLNNKQTEYSTLTAQTGSITTYYSFSGNVIAKNSKTVLADSATQISSIKVKEGSVVKKDAVLMTTITGQNITAPIAGTVSKLYVDANSVANMGTKLCDIVDYANLQATVKVDEYDVSTVTKGKSATVHINSLDKDVTGTISDISKEGATQSGVTYYTATINLPKESSILIGMSVEVKLVSAHVENVITLPMTAIQFDSQNNPYVYTGTNKKPVKTSITTGVNDGTTVEVKSGIDASTTILVPITATNSSTSMYGPSTSATTGGN